MKIGVVGLGKLGLPLALTYASENNTVLVYDRNEVVRNAVKAQKPHIDEPFVNEMLHTTPLQVTTTLDAVAKHSDVIFIVVPTPTSKTSGAFSDAYIRDVISELPAQIQDRHAPKVVAIVSTVSPGAFTGDSNLNDAVKALGYQLAYVPTLIALGTVVHDLIYPDVQIVGVETADSFATVVVTSALRTITKSPFVVTDFESAALAKLASNVFVTIKIGFANVLAQVCDEIGADVDDVTRILGLNKRIGPKSLTAGAGYGGPCFPRDAAAFAAINTSLSSSSLVLGDITQNLNKRHLRYIVDRVRNFVVGVNATYAVLGREYKENSFYNIESFGDAIAQELDQYFTQAEHDEADVVVVAQPLRDQRLRVKAGAVVYDLWRTHRYLAGREDITYVQLGRRNDND